MATIRQVITAQLGKYAIELTAESMDMLLVDHDLNGDDTYSKSHVQSVKRALLSEVAALLAKPDVTEGGMSLKWDRASVEKYCNQLKQELGMVDSDGPTIKDITDRW